MVTFFFRSLFPLTSCWTYYNNRELYRYYVSSSNTLHLYVFHYVAFQPDLRIRPSSIPNATFCICVLCSIITHKLALLKFDVVFREQFSATMEGRTCREIKRPSILRSMHHSLVPSYQHLLICDSRMVV